METKVLVTERASAPDDKAILETRGQIPNVKVITLPRWKMAGIRASRTYLQGLAANILTLGTAVAALKALEFPLPANAFLAGCIAVPVEPLRTAVTTFIQNYLEITKEWDKTNPELRG